MENKLYNTLKFSSLTAFSWHQTVPLAIITYFSHPSRPRTSPVASLKPPLLYKCQSPFSQQIMKCINTINLFPTLESSASVSALKDMHLQQLDQGFFSNRKCHWSMKTVSFLNPDFIKTSLIGGLTVRREDADGLFFQRRLGRLTHELTTDTHPGQGTWKTASTYLTDLISARKGLLWGTPVTPQALG